MAKLRGIVNKRATPPRRAEVLISFCRLILAIASLIAIYVDPFEPARNPELCYSLLVGYSLYSAVLLVITSRGGTSLRQQIGTHTFDLLFFMVINGLTEGPVSPFFVYYVFAIICSGLRFGTRAIILTATAAIAAFAASGVYVLHAGSPETFEFNRFIIRGTYLAIIALLLTYFASYFERIKEDLSRIAGWRRSRQEELGDLVAELLETGTQIFRCSRMIVAFTDDATTAGFCGVRTDSFRCEELPESTAEDLVTFALGQSATQPWVLPANLAALLEVTAHVGVPLEGDQVRGIALFLDREAVVEEDIALGHVISRIIAARLDHFATTLQLRRGAVAEERVRLARDLHDSLLQSLTGVALQLRALPRLMQRDVTTASERLQEIGDTIAADQRELRQFIERLQSSREESVSTIDIETRVAALARRFEQQWDLRVNYILDPSLNHVSEALRSETYSIISEAIANAAKHANANMVDVRAEATGTSIVIHVADDGNGFPFQGRYSLEELSQIKRGPVTLKERVSSLDGDLFVDSSPQGARLEIRIPLH